MPQNLDIFPPIVPRWFFPQSVLRGPFEAVLYHTHNRGQHLALGRTEKALLSVWSEAVQNVAHDDTLKLACWHLHFVDPPEEVAVALDRKRFADCLDGFLRDLGSASSALALPTGMRPCGDHEYLGDPDYGPASQYKREFSNLGRAFVHEYCERCVWGMLWEGDESPEAQRSMWEALLRNPEVVRLIGERRLAQDVRHARGKPARAPLRERPLPAPGPPCTHVLGADFGHHHSGLELCEFKPEVAESNPESFVAFASARASGFPTVDKVLADLRADIKRENDERKRKYALGRKQEEEARLRLDLQLLEAFEATRVAAPSAEEKLRIDAFRAREQEAQLRLDQDLLEELEAARDVT